MTLRDVARTIKKRSGYDVSSLIPDRPSWGTTAEAVTPDSALRHSAMWASVRLRANMISSLPLHVYRDVPGTEGGNTVQAKVTTPPVLINPSGRTGATAVRIREWMYSTQMDLDRYGNCFGIIELRDAAGNPMRIRLVSAGKVTVLQDRDTGVVTYRIGQTIYSEHEIWHERQYTISGLPVGLSPIAYAAMSVSQYLSAQDFAVNWYTGNATPAGILRNNAKLLDPGQAAVHKERFKNAMKGGGQVFVTGKDWEFQPVQAESNDTMWLNSMGSSAIDIARYMDVPGDMIDAAVNGSSITYASITQRFLQFLVIHLGPAVGRREEALSTVLPKPRSVQLDTDALLRMDPATLSTMLGQQIKDRIRTSTEVRGTFYNLPPMSDADVAAHADAFGTKGATVAPAPAAPTDTTDEGTDQ